VGARPAAQGGRALAPPVSEPANGPFIIAYCHSWSVLSYHRFPISVRLMSINEKEFLISLYLLALVDVHKNREGRWRRSSEARISQVLM
jgi:hypothetical protein